MRHSVHIWPLLGLGLLAGLAEGAFGARFPDTIERTFVVEGAPAREFSALFGIASGHEQTLIFPIYGSVGMSSDLNYGGQGSNRIIFSSNEGKYRVVLGNYWRDNATGSAHPVPRYAFMSPLIDPSLTVDNGWGILLRKLHVELPKTKEHAAVVAHVHTDEDTSPFLDVLVYIIYDYVKQQWVYRSEIGIDFRDRVARREAMERYEHLYRDGEQQR